MLRPRRSRHASLHVEIPSSHPAAAPLPFAAAGAGARAAQGNGLQSRTVAGSNSPAPSVGGRLAEAAPSPFRTHRKRPQRRASIGIGAASLMAPRAVSSVGAPADTQEVTSSTLVRPTPQLDRPAGRSCVLRGPGDGAAVGDQQLEDVPIQHRQHRRSAHLAARRAVQDHQSGRRVQGPHRPTAG